MMKNNTTMNNEKYCSMSEVLDLQKELNAGLEKLNQYIIQHNEKMKSMSICDRDYLESTSHAKLFETIRHTNSKILKLAENRKRTKN